MRCTTPLPTRSWSKRAARPTPSFYPSPSDAVRFTFSVMLRHALLFCLATAGCGGLTERDRRPEDWHPVGGPVEVPLRTGEVRLVNDGIESVWQISALAREWSRPPDCSERTTGACTVRSCEEPLAG